MRYWVLGEEDRRGLGPTARSPVRVSALFDLGEVFGASPIVVGMSML
jgi:hypothetical protein